MSVLIKMQGRPAPWLWLSSCNQACKHRSSEICIFFCDEPVQVNIGSCCTKVEQQWWCGCLLESHFHFKGFLLAERRRIMGTCWDDFTKLTLKTFLIPFLLFWYLYTHITCFFLLSFFCKMQNTLTSFIVLTSQTPPHRRDFIFWYQPQPVLPHNSMQNQCTW